MNLFKKYDSICLYGTGLKKGEVIIIGPAYLIPNSPGPDQYIVYKVYKFTLFRRILEFFGKPFKYHNCVRLRNYIPSKKLNYTDFGIGLINEPFTSKE